MKLNRTFNTKLLDKNSQEFTILANEVEAAMEPELKKTMPNLLKVQVTDFRSGSIAVDFNIILNETNGGGKLNPGQALTNVRNVIRNGNVASLNPDISALPTIQGILKGHRHISLHKKMKFSIMEFFSKWIWSHLLKKPVKRL